MTDRQQMLQDIARLARLTAAETERGRFTTKVMAAVGSVKREQFVPEGVAIEAYENIPLPIGYEQTISQPYIVALMTDLLDTEADQVCLEVGTGSGYQAAVLSQLVAKVYSIEIIAPLYREASERLRRLHYDNVEVMLGNGYLGYPEAAPFDRIIVTAAAEEVPPALLEQLKPGGRMIIPVGPEYGGQVLYQVDKDDTGMIESSPVLDVRFVPLIQGSDLSM
ncbi:protein-L-isoaspartate(D-aspartate) O-methyltransferase [Pontibacterium granulatum]|uniref:protein-L-isoaspartate(D-aspartate) O-methyltransferase n=1 Tax=Pontibacterium granulatum TaxID=2036029 RepID=UPI00249B02A2|nr:protein-L-isoaspartate(D-aspartate) O-methyltransferase [Pontibacterium granulatum]MDI3323789.1 protein-L-isoaspartate(D-aspartate) O-methyltransferase [Pontibacterium granulatum]